MSIDIEQTARTLDRAQSQAQPTQQLGDDLTIEDAYAVQAQILRLRTERGESYCGPKLGFTSKAKMEQMGVSDIIVGFLTREMELPAGRPLSLQGLIHPRIEPELVFRLGSAVEPREHEDVTALAGRIRDAVDAVAIGMEVIDSRYENFRFSLSDVVADNTSAARFVLGPWQSFPRPLSGLDVDFVIDEKTVEQGSSDAILGNPLNAFDQLAAMTLKYGFSLPAGAPVLAGAMTPAVYLAPGQRVTARVASFPELTVDVEAGERK